LLGGARHRAAGTGVATKALVSCYTFGFWITPGEASLNAAAAPMP
jgi:hypothetical protein